MPPLPGFWTKLIVLVALAQQGPMELAAMGAILVVTAIEANYLFRLAVMLYRKDEAEPAQAQAFTPALGAGLVAPLLALVLLGATVAIVPVTEGLRTVARQTVDVAAYVNAVFPSAQPPLARKD